MASCTQYNFKLGTLVFSTNKTDRHDIAEILLKVVLKHHKPKPTPLNVVYDDHDKLTADRHQVNRIKYLMCAVSEGSGLSNKNIISLYTRDH
jgi:hypothetical protein